MPEPRPITIVGGGLAGLTLGLGLRRAGVATRIVEAGHYPRHRVCGEFVSGRGVEVLRQLGCLEPCLAAGGRFARTAAFYDAQRAYPARTLPEPALCLSRHVLDHLLAEQFVQAGGELRTGERSPDRELAAGTVRATGRRPQAMTAGWRWVGLKAHVRGARLSTDLEMHFLRNGYVGLCAHSDGVTNVCGLFRHSGPLPDLARTWRDFLSGPPGSPLREHLATATWIEDSFCSVAGISVAPRHAADSPGCAIGDAVTMTPPWTGNGMSMAFESGALATTPLAAFARGDQDWNATRNLVARHLDARFARRLGWAALLNRALFQPGAQATLLRLGSRSSWLWRALFSLTR